MPCARCDELIMAMKSAFVEARAIQQDHAVNNDRSALFAQKRYAQRRNALVRWRAAVSELRVHQATHFQT